MRALVASARFELVAASDTSPKALAEAENEYAGINCFFTYEAMLRVRPTDLVCISTYVPSHTAILRAALEAGRLRGLLLEKPVADTTSRAQEALRLIESAGIPTVVPHGLLVAAHSKEVLRRVGGGDIGRLELAGIRCDKWDIIYAGIHWFNFFVTLTGGTLEFYGWDSEYRIANRESPDGLHVAVPRYERTNHQIHLENLAGMMDSGSADCSVLRSGVNAVEICEAAYLSNRERCNVTLPLDRFRPKRFGGWDPGIPYDGKGGGRDGRSLPEGERRPPRVPDAGATP